MRPPPTPDARTIKVKIGGTETVGYEIPNRRLIWRPDNGRGPSTETKVLPVRFEALLTDTDLRLRAVLVLDRIQHGDDLIVGVRRVDLVNDDEPPGPISPATMRLVPLRDLLIEGIRGWSFNSDGSDVTRSQAEYLAGYKGETAKPPETDEERWRRAATAWVGAKMAGKQTTPAVITACGYEPSKGPAARMLVSKARAKGVLATVAIELGATEDQLAEWKLVRP